MKTKKHSGKVRLRDWSNSNGTLGRFISEESNRTLRAYKEQPNLIREHANHEHDTSRGGYAHRQLFELIQNSADAHSQTMKQGKIQVHLTKSYLYCADDGQSLNKDGVRALMSAHLSPKRGTNEIGRFGLGFKSMLGVSDRIEFFSRTGSLRFSKEYAAERIQENFGEGSESLGVPTLRQPEPIDPQAEFEHDSRLRMIAFGANNIVRLRLINGASLDLSTQMEEFPSPFLLFVDRVRNLTLKDDVSGQTRNLRRKRKHNTIVLLDSEKKSTWNLHTWKHRLSDESIKDSRTLDDSNEVAISWAVPLNNLSDSGYFWAYFPTTTASLLAGILNAPWKTNEDRQNLLSGPYNQELIDAAARNIASALPMLSTTRDPAQHLDALPRRHESGDSAHADRLREQLLAQLQGHNVVPDQDGMLQGLHTISYPPSELTRDRNFNLEPFERWSAYARRPRNWLHNSALSRNRLAALDRLFLVNAKCNGTNIQKAPRSSVANWFKALVSSDDHFDSVGASKAAICVAALVPETLRARGELGSYVIDASGRNRSPELEQIFLPGDQNDEDLLGPEWYIHPELASDEETVLALHKLGFAKPTEERIFQEATRRVLHHILTPETEETELCFFWQRSRRLPLNAAHKSIVEHKLTSTNQPMWPNKLKVRTLGGTWQHLHSVLFPGPVVTDRNCSDKDLAIDTGFHNDDRELLQMLGACDQPEANRDLSSEPEFENFEFSARTEFRNLEGLPHVPEMNYLEFKSVAGVGPLNVLTKLSDESAALYSNYLLNFDSVFEKWEMSHIGSNRKLYPTANCESFELFMIRRHGRVKTAEGIQPIADALGEDPKNHLALQALLKHPRADKIRQALKLADPVSLFSVAPEVAGDEDPVPLCDIWPGLKHYLPTDMRMARLVRCEQVRTLSGPATCVSFSHDVFLARSVGEDGASELSAVVEALDLNLSAQEKFEILQHRTAEEIQLRRKQVRSCATDAERLLEAVGSKLLREQLPESYLDVEEHNGSQLSDLEIAEAAIANWHTGALREFASSLIHLDPPNVWAGSRRAVEFVKSLGFSPEWAGERVRKREPYLEVIGPFTLPPLHTYQNKISENVKKLLTSENHADPSRRGMVSLPTGSGKTRVAVQAIVEAMRDGYFAGGILWIADRDELCEQAVESWNQVWSCFGADSSILRISRLWSGQPTPLPVSNLHVIVASIQTLKSRLTSQRSHYEFLADFRLIVYDEAHRSIAPSSTSVMADIGLTRFQGPKEPFLIGLTATPYRGHDEAETHRLVRRYGGNRLDDGAFASDDPQAVVEELQGMGVLALADHEVIEGETFSLDHFSTEEWSKLQDWDLPWLPEQVETRIASSVKRTRRIIDAYETHIRSGWPTLIFATSVEHAQTLAALLNRRGVKSRAVSGKTERAVRRRIVEEFRAGEITALVNYGVFREGFDAPKTRAIIVARPVYSPNLYFQMIGRGLRGPRNGGDERCLILNVQDNIEKFSRELAFSELDWLWSKN